MSLQGRLTGLGGEDLPTIVIVAHYDAFGVAPVCPRPPRPAGGSSFRLAGLGELPTRAGVGPRQGGISRVWAELGSSAGEEAIPAELERRTEGKIVGVGFRVGPRPGWRWVVLRAEVG